VAALEIRKDRTATVLRMLAKAEADTRGGAPHAAIANALDGMSREEAARSAGMDRQNVCATGCCATTSMDRPASPTAGRWSAAHVRRARAGELMRIVLDGPDPEASGLSPTRSRPGQYLRAALRKR